jgi:hypothetical protein
MKIVKKYGLNVSVLVFCTIFSWWLMSSTFGYRDGSIVIDSKLYSDFGAHLPLIRSFSLGWNFPPQYPFFIGEPIRYHYLFYLLIGLLERSGVRIDLAVNLLSAGGFSLLLFMIYIFAKTIFRSSLAGVLAVILFLFNGSLAWVEFFNQHGWTWEALTSIPQQSQFASFGPWSGRLVSAFWNWNIFTNQRHLGLSYGMFLLLLYPLIRLSVMPKESLKERWSRSLTSLFGGVLGAVKKVSSKKNSNQLFNRYWWQPLLVVSFVIFPLLHQAAYIILVPLTLIWIGITWPKSKSVLLVYGFAVLVSIIVFKVFTPQSGSLPIWQIGYLSPEKTLMAINWYWFNNLGLYWLLLPVLLIWAVIKKQWWIWTALPFFVIANLFRFSADMINNHKLITFFIIALQITTAGFLVSLVKQHKVFLIIIVPLLVGLTSSGIIDVFPITNDYDGEISDWKKSPMQQWIKNNTQPQAQFLTASYMYSPASLVGRYLYLDYGYHAWSMGYSDSQKRRNLEVLWAQSPNHESWCTLLHREKIDAILVGPGENNTEDGRINVAESYVVSKLQPTFISEDNWKIWMVNQICPKK